MTELQQNRYDQLLRRVGGLIGAKSMVSDSLGELFPTIDVENMPMELLYLSGWFVGVGTIQVTGVAAEFSTVQLFNPATSGKLAVVTTATISSSTAGLVEWDLTNTDLGGVVANQKQRDTRISVAERMTCALTGQAEVAGIPDFGLLFLEAQVQQAVRDDNGICVLAPGTGLTFAHTVAQANLRATMLWRERVAEPAELLFGG